MYHRDSGQIENDSDLRAELEEALSTIEDIDAAGHRIVHGGETFTQPIRIDSGFEKRWGVLGDLAPLHNPPALSAIRLLGDLAPGLPGVACFDTTFHLTMPEAATTYALPKAWREKWPLRRFGFHGLSHEYVSRKTAENLNRPLSELRIVSAHLGSGASLCAIDAGRSVDTTMGFTPVEGLVMATRSGSVDPGLILWLQQYGDINRADVEEALDSKSGLLGLCGTSDMREVLARRAAGDPSSSVAFDVYIHKLCQGIASMAASMNGLDALVFTGGIGENAAEVRESACQRLSFLGIDCEPSVADQEVVVLVIEAREDLQIAAGVREVVS